MAHCTSAEPMTRCLRFFSLIVLVLSCTRGHAQNSGSTAAPRDPKKPVLKAKAPIEVIGRVIAHDADGGMSLGLVEGGYLDVLVIRIEKVLKGHLSGKYVRADFLGGGSENLPSSLFEGNPWIMKLEPVKPHHFRTCDWTIPPIPPPGDLTREFKWVPQLTAVGAAKTYPDVNALHCYVLELKNLREISSNLHR
jgi:hypothetical protein